MRCLVCDSTDKWKNVDEYRIKPVGMAICMECGFVSYPTLYKTPEEIKAYYRKDYRKPPMVQNLWTGMRKLHFHSTFLTPLFKEWAKEGRNEPEIFEIGSAYGIFLNWVRQVIPKAKVAGTELTTTFRRVALQQYGIELKEDFDDTKKYDLICSYKVAEHMLDIDKELEKYAACLKVDGFLYISIPAWWQALENFGAEGFDLEYYYSPNHINVWSRKHFEGLLNKAGLEIVREDHLMYGETYLCRANSAVKAKGIHKEDPAQILDTMKRIKEAATVTRSFLNTQDAIARYDKALELYPNNPHAWMGRYEMLRSDLNKQGYEVTFDMVFERFCKPFMAACPNSVLPYIFSADLAMRYDQFEIAINFFNKSLEMVPNLVKVLMNMSHCFRQLAQRETNPEKKLTLLTNARDLCKHIVKTDLQHTPEAVNWIYSDEANMPLPSEITKES